MKNILLLLMLIFSVIGNNAFAQQVGKIDDYYLEILDKVRVERGRVRYNGLFNNPFSEITEASELPTNVINSAYEYVRPYGNYDLIRVYKINGPRPRINDHRAVGYVTVFGRMTADVDSRSTADFLYLFSNYRGRVVYFLGSQTNL